MTATADIFKKTFTQSNFFPEPGSAEEKIVFNDIQLRFKEQFEKIFPDKLAPRTVVAFRLMRKYYLK